MAARSYFATPEDRANAVSGIARFAKYPVANVEKWADGVLDEVLIHIEMGEDILPAVIFYGYDPVSGVDVKAVQRAARITERRRSEAGH